MNAPSPRSPYPVLCCAKAGANISCPTVFYKFQSYGECYGTCTKDNNFALSVIQGKNCWCSDYAPSVTTDTDDCHEACPGYPDDICGGPNLFVYYQLNKVPVGTKGGSSPTSDTTSQVSAFDPFLPSHSRSFSTYPIVLISFPHHHWQQF